MTRRTRITVLAILVSFCAGAALAQAFQHSVVKDRAGQEIGQKSWSELMLSMAKMHAAMASVHESDKTDVDFVRLMLPHHQAAVDMAKTELLYGKDPQARRLAQEIIADQQSEIELMRLWLVRGEGH